MVGEREGKWKVRVKPETEDSFTESSFQDASPCRSNWVQGDLESYHPWLSQQQRKMQIKKARNTLKKITQRPEALAKAFLPSLSTVSTSWLDVTDALCSNFIRCQDKHNIQQRVTLYHFLVFLARGLWKWFAIFKTNLSCFCSTLWMEKVKDSLWYLGWIIWVKKKVVLFSFTAHRSRF